MLGLEKCTEKKAPSPNRDADALMEITATAKYGGRYLKIVWCVSKCTMVHTRVYLDQTDACALVLCRIDSYQTSEAVIPVQHFNDI